MSLQHPVKWPITQVRLGAGLTCDLDLGSRYPDLARCETVAAAVAVIKTHLAPHEAQSLEEFSRQDGLVLSIRQGSSSRVLTRRGTVQGGMLSLESTPKVHLEFSAAMKGGAAA
jgi:hypothetical protein